MRLKQNRIQTFYHRTAEVKKDSEGGTYVEYGEPGEFEAEEWPGGGKMQAEMYGIRLPNIRNCRVNGGYKEVHEPGKALLYTVAGGPSFTVGDGICLYSGLDGEPDYRIVAIYPYRFLTLELERI